MNKFELFKEYSDVLTAKHLQTMLHVSRSTAYNLMNAEDFPTTIISGNKRVMKHRLIEWLESHTNY